MMQQYLFFFFFQAEDGIRDLTVTGVQTCALPIWLLMMVSGVSACAGLTCWPRPSATALSSDGSARKPASPCGYLMSCSNPASTAWRSSRPADSLLSLFGAA